jgi:hypothetical protein
VVVVLFKMGDQVPVILLFETVGSAGMLAPPQNGPTLLNDGTTLELIVTVRSVSAAH